MADASSVTAGGDKGPKEERLSIHQPVGDVEMEDLSKSQPKPANPDTTTSPLPPNHDAEATKSTFISDKDGSEVGEGDTELSSKAQGKARVTSENADQDLTIDPIAPAGSPSGGDGDLAVEIMLLLTSGARHPFRIDAKYLAKRNVTVTGMTEDGKTDPFSITVYTLKELILREWRKEWDEPPREPGAIRLIHFGKLLEDRHQLNHYQFTAARNVVHMTIKPQDLIDEEEAAKKGKDSGISNSRGCCCVIL